MVAYLAVSKDVGLVALLVEYSDKFSAFWMVAWTVYESVDKWALLQGE